MKPIYVIFEKSTGVYKGQHIKTKIYHHTAYIKSKSPKRYEDFIEDIPPKICGSPKFFRGIGAVKNSLYYYTDRNKLFETMEDKNYRIDEVKLKWCGYYGQY